MSTKPSRLLAATSMFVCLLCVSARAQSGSPIVTDWTGFSANSASGVQGGVSITATTAAASPFIGTFNDRLEAGSGFWQAPLPLPSGSESIAVSPVNAGSFQAFAFSSPLTDSLLYIENFDFASVASITTSGATTVTLLASSPSISFSPSGTGGVLRTSNFTGSGEGDLVLRLEGPVTAVRLDYSQGLLDNAIFYTFVTTPQPSEVIPEPGTCALLATGLLPLVCLAARRRRA